MARAFICLARNDIPVASLQNLDLLPYTSQRSLIYDPTGQTGYLTFQPQNDVVAVTPGGGGFVTVDTYYGLAIYLMGNVENVGGGNLTLDGPQTIAITDDILDAVAAGTVLDQPTIDAYINAAAGVSGSGLAVGASTASVDDILRVLNGEAYVVLAGTLIAGAAGAYLPARVGYFATSPNLVENLLHPGGRGGQEPINTRTATQTPPEDLGFRNVLRVEETSDMHRSALDGRLALMADAAYTFENPDFTYGAAGTALATGGANIGTDHAGRAVTVYKADGTVLI
jgi:hypothetical protein